MRTGEAGGATIRRTPVFVLTNYPRAPIAMKGDTTFYFVTDGIHAARRRAFAAANGKDVELGGGIATIRQYIEAGLVDEMRYRDPAPVLLGQEKRCLRISICRGFGYRYTGHLASTQRHPHRDWQARMSTGYHCL